MARDLPRRGGLRLAARGGRPIGRGGRGGGSPAGPHTRRRGSGRARTATASSSSRLIRAASARWSSVRGGSVWPSNCSSRLARNVIPMTDATPRASRPAGSRASIRAPRTARSVTGTRGGPVSISATRPSRHSSVPSSRNARTVSPMNSGLPAVRSWMLRTPSASTAARATSVASRAVSGSARPCRSRRSTIGLSAQAGMPLGRVPAKHDQRPVARRLDEQLDHDTLDGSSQCRSSMTMIRGPATVSSRSI